MRRIILTVLASLLAAPAGADVILVPGDVPTVQGAIDVANAGDEIVVAAGTWNGPISLLGKAITLRSASGPLMTTIDGGGTNHAVVRCVSGETNDTVIAGFAITGGHFSPGSLAGGHGVIIVGTSPTFEDCRFVTNVALAGGGVLVDGGAPRFTDCRFSGNFASDGGALAVRGGADVRMDDTEFLFNDVGGGANCFSPHATPGCGSPACTIEVCAVDPFCCTVDWDAGCVVLAEDECNLNPRGGAIWVVGASLTLDGFSIQNNECEFTNPTVSKTTGTGGGIYAEGGATVRLRSGSLTANSAFAGGGVYSQASTLIVAGTVFSGNDGLFGGGAVRSYQGTLVMVNSLLVDNTASVSTGGGVSAGSNAPIIANCAVLYNEASFNAGLDVGGNAIVSNCIVRDNLGGQVGAGATVRWSNVAGGYPGAGNIDAALIYANPGSGSYRPAGNSPGVDAGHVWLVPDDLPDVDDDGLLDELVSLDLDGAPRFADAAAPDAGCGPGAVVDMGPYEFAGTPGPAPARGDLNADGVVDVTDLVALILAWGPCVADCCPADVDVDGAVGVGDLVTLILHWG